MKIMINELNGAVIAAAITGIITLIGVITNIILIKSQSKKQRTAEIITRNRVEWIQQFKKYISEYNSLVYYNYDREIPKDLNNYFEKITDLTYQIKLHLNFKGKQDREIVKRIEDLNSSLERFLQLTKDKEGLSKKTLFTKGLIEFYLDRYPEIGHQAAERIYKKDGLNLENSNEVKEYLIYMETNTAEAEDKFITEVVECIDKDLGKCVRNVKHTHLLIILLTQIYLKTEWERVKIEAEKGKKTTFNFDKIYDEIRERVKDEVNELINLIEKD